MPSAVIVETQRQRSVARPALIALGAIVAAAVLWLVLGLTRTPTTVSRLTVVNPSSLAVEIDVSPASNAATLGLGPLTAGTSHTFHDVLDQGSTWIVDVSWARGRHAQLVVDREELARSDWTIQLPAELGDQVAR